MNVYQTLPSFKGKNFFLRELRETDCADLFNVYSDEKAVPFFNGDNCHGDDFYYSTPERMKEAIDFWQYSYAHGYFVRWVVEETRSGKAVGTIELFHRDGNDEFYGNCGLLRLDLKSETETAETIEEILSLIVKPAYDLFDCDKVVTKIKPFMTERLNAAAALGFKRIPHPLVSESGEKYHDYYALKKR